MDTAGTADLTTHSSLLNTDDAKKLQETTTRYDALGRSIASTVWLQPLGWWMFRLRRLLTLTVSPDTDDLTTLYDVDRQTALVWKLHWLASIGLRF